MVRLPIGGGAEDVSPQMMAMVLFGLPHPARA
jgi:hypothetical protein